MKLKQRGLRFALRCFRAPFAVLGRIYKGLKSACALQLANFVAKHLAQIPQNVGAEIFSRHGFHLLRKHYYSPIPEDQDIPDSYWARVSELPGCDMNEQAGLDLLANIFPKYMPEFRGRFPIEKESENPGFFLINGAYMAVDAHVYYAFIRHFKPRRIVEIGSGNTTLLAASACLANREETGQAPRFTAIEPYWGAAFADGIPGLTEFIPKKAQDVDLDVFEALGKNDILFIDSSHVLRAGNDVEYEYLEILPRLKSGVLVHIHDVSLPRRYPKRYFDQQLYWNEQQLLQAFLAFNSRFEVVWAGNYMDMKYPERVNEVFPELEITRRRYPGAEASAFWMRVK